MDSRTGVALVVTYFGLPWVSRSASAAGNPQLTARASDASEAVPIGLTGVVRKHSLKNAAM
jgi:hypothetical protein